MHVLYRQNSGDVYQVLSWWDFNFKLYLPHAEQLLRSRLLISTLQLLGFAVIFGILPCTFPLKNSAKILCIHLGSLSSLDQTFWTPSFKCLSRINLLPADV